MPMAFDLNTVSPEVKQRIPEVKETAQTQEVPLEAPQMEQRPSVEYAQAPTAQPVKIEIPSEQAPVIRLEKDELLSEVEGLLADEKIMKIYETLPEKLKPTFRSEGEELARDIRDAIRGHKLRPYKVLEGIRKWLGMIPKVEKFFLLQEAKIDLDKVLGLVEAFEKGEGNLM
jgi:hypothetical protein